MAFLKQYEVLLKKAKVDFVAAKFLLEGVDKGELELDLEIILFHLQQSTEKQLKALLAYNQIHITKTHDIRRLIDILNEANIESVDSIEELIPLTDFAVEGRYAIIHDDLSCSSQYISIIQELIVSVEHTII
jgi:HEPN domain-containing protein